MEGSQQALNAGGQRPREGASRGSGELMYTWLSGKDSTSQCRRHQRDRFDPWVGTIPWRRKWQPLYRGAVGRRLPTGLGVGLSGARPETVRFPNTLLPGGSLTEGRP